MQYRTGAERGSRKNAALSYSTLSDFSALAFRRDSVNHAAFINRRQWLGTAGMGALGLNLGTLLQAQAAADNQATLPRQRLQACILLYQYGGPSHLDTFDLKPQAPAEIRGEFQPIATSVSGLQIAEHLPRLAPLMDKVALIRSMHHANRLHDAAGIETLTGRPLAGGDRELFAPLPQFFPSHGSALAYLWRDRHLDVPCALLPFLFHNVVDVPCHGAGFLGTAYEPFRIEGDPSSRNYRAEMLTMPGELTVARMQHRRSLLDGLDKIQGDDAATRQLRRFYDRAYQLLGSAAIRRALDLSQESDRTRERYGYYTTAKAYSGGGAGLGYGREIRGQNLLLARRLVEAGVPFVTVNDYKQQGQNWDAHGFGFQEHRHYLLPPFDRSMSALIEDLDGRGLLDTTLIVALGEFGRTPKINANAGRDHWPDCYSVFLAGGGVRGGYVHGASDSQGAYPALDPVTPADLAATIFWRFGIDPATEIHDLTGRPYRLADGTPMRHLFD